MPNFHLCQVITDRVYDLQDLTTHVGCVTIADNQLLIPAEYIVGMLTDIKAFGWTCKSINDPSLMPGLKWQNNNVGNVETLD